MPCGSASCATASGDSRGSSQRAMSLRRGQLSEHDAQRVAQVELVVAVGAEHERRRRVGLPGQQPHDVEGGLVGPVQVLDDEDRRRAARELAQQRVGHRRAARASPAVACARSPPVSSATSSSGPSARGVNSASHAPHRIRADSRCSSAKRRASAVFPAPASPVTSTSAPARRAADAVEHGGERLELTASARAGRSPVRAGSPVLWTRDPLMPPRGHCPPGARGPQAG